MGAGMRNVLVVVAVTLGVLVAPKARAQSVLPRAGWVANASSSQGGDVPANVLDGSRSPRWTTGGDQTPGEWLSIDMQTAQTFTQAASDGPAAQTRRDAAQASAKSRKDQIALPRTSIRGSFCMKSHFAMHEAEADP